MTLGLTAIAAAGGWRCAKMLRQCLRAATLVGVLAFSSALLAESPGEGRAYKLAPGDRIAVTVFGQPELSGELVVDEAGGILLPLIGQLVVGDLTMVECQKLIRDRLADGILNQPSVSVAIRELRPIYVLGDVRVPGAYPFRFGSTVKSAVALAGGFGPIQLLQSTALSEFLLADERVHQLSFQKIALRVRLARLEAQRDSSKTFSPPSPSNATEEANVADVVALEKATFDSQAVMLQNQLDLLRSQKPRLQNEIEALTAQHTTVKKELALVREHVDQYNRLVKQGLGLANAELQLKLTEATQEGQLWRLSADISRLQMEAGNLDVQIYDAEAIFKKQVTTELQDVHGRLRELEVTLPSAREIREVKLQQVGSAAGAETARSISVTRTRNGETTDSEATDVMPLEPGDIVEVKPVLPSQSLRSATIGDFSPNPDRLRAAAPEPPIAAAAR